MISVGFTGTRGTLTPPQDAQLSTLLHVIFGNLDANEWHEGGCIGADSHAHYIVDGINRLNAGRARRPDEPPFSRIKTINHLGDIPETYSGLVYDETRPARRNLDRNHDIVDESKIMVACPSSMNEVLRSGTWATIRYARKQIKKRNDLFLFLVWPDGTMSLEGATK